MNETVWTADLNGLYSACLQAPDEDVPRLAFADALDEGANGVDAEVMRAWSRVIRTQCAASVGACDSCRRSSAAESFFVGSRGLRRLTPSLSEALDRRVGCACGAERRRQQAARDYLLSYPAFVKGAVCKLSLRSWLGRSLPDCPIRRVELSRGMIDGVSLSTADFMRHAKRLAEFHPVQYYWLHDRRPGIRPRTLAGHGEAYRFSSGWRVGTYSFLEGGGANAPDELPDVLWQRVRWEMDSDGVREVHYPREAYRYLMRACLRYARKAAGLDAVAAGRLVKPVNVGPLPG